MRGHSAREMPPKTENDRCKDVQYGGASFIAASRIARSVLRRDGAGRPVRPARWPIEAGAFLRLVVRLPRVTVSLTDSPRGRVIGAYLRARHWGVRSHLLARGVLALPQTPDAYLRGRSRRAVRTNVSRATKEGVRCTPLPNGAAAEAAVRRLADHGLVSNPAVLLARSADEWVIARDRDGDVVGGALVTVDRTWAMLNLLVGVTYPVRYALHTELVLNLGAAGVKHLFPSCNSALVLPEGSQYFQQILGYRIVNLSLPN